MHFIKNFSSITKSVDKVFQNEKLNITLGKSSHLYTNNTTDKLSKY